MVDLVQNEQQAKSSSRSNEESSKSESLEDKNSFGEKLVPPNASSTPKSEDSEDELANTRTFSSENKLNSPEKYKQKLEEKLLRKVLRRNSEKICSSFYDFSWFCTHLLHESEP